MKRYICLNRIDCDWADEKPPREFELPSDDIRCPNCESTNVREVEKFKPPITRLLPFIAGAILLLSVILYFWLKGSETLQVSVSTSCTNNTVIVSTVGGNGNPVSFNSPELKKRQADSVFRIPANKRSGTTLTFWAVQGSDSVKTSLVTNCEKPITSDGGHNEGGYRNPPPYEHGAKENSSSVVWNRVKGSEFCDLDMNCIQYYSETNSLGQTREGKRKNCAACGKAEDKTQ